MKLSDFDYCLPQHLIAQYPLETRSASRLLCVDITSGALQHKQFTDLLSLISPKDLVVCNNSRVIAARLFGRKSSGGQVELLIERILDDHRVLALARSSKKLKPGQHIFCDNDILFEVIAKKEDLYECICLAKQSVLEVIETIGQLPLPPYVGREPSLIDHDRYQTIYASAKGSVAAPTAGLHFDEAFMAACKDRQIQIDYLTLHVGAGTFKPVRVENITEHKLHAERIEISAELCEKIRATKAKGGRIIAVGTTTVRSLETASQQGGIQPFSGETDIFIYPGYQFKTVDAMLTNFHLPCSTLLMLVAAFGGHETIMKAYHEAVKEQYRFFSYGDAMFLAATNS